jgi:DNA repair exonuclease SbcCD nuclease subunit
MITFRFVHISDTHLGSRQYSIKEREDDFYDAFTEAVQIALDQEVDFVVHSGDLFDEHRPDNRALSVFRDNIIKLQAKKIPFYMIMGDHDRPKKDDIPASKIFDFLGVKVLGMEEYESVVHSNGSEKILIGGISNMKGLRRERLKSQYEKANFDAAESKMAILISHQAISPYFISEQCEATSEELPVNFNYMAFGHIHNRLEKKIGNSIFSYAGSTEIKSTNEIDFYMRHGKSINMVSIENDQTNVEKIGLKSVRPQLIVKGTLENVLKSIDVFASKNRERLEVKKGILTMEIQEKISPNDVIDAVSQFNDLFLIRTPIIKAQESEKHNVSAMTDSLKDMFLEYFADDKNIGKTAYEIYRDIMDNEPEVAVKSIEKRLGIEGTL